MAAEEVIVKIQNTDGQYHIAETIPAGWGDMFRKMVQSDPLFLGVEIGQNLADGILFQFVIDN